MALLGFDSQTFSAITSNQIETIFFECPLKEWWCLGIEVETWCCALRVNRSIKKIYLGHVVLEVELDIILPAMELFSQQGRNVIIYLCNDVDENSFLHSKLSILPNIQVIRLAQSLQIAYQLALRQPGVYSPSGSPERRQRILEWEQPILPSQPSSPRRSPSVSVQGAAPQGSPDRRERLVLPEPSSPARLPNVSSLSLGASNFSPRSSFERRQRLVLPEPSSPARSLAASHRIERPSANTFSFPTVSPTSRMRLVDFSHPPEPQVLRETLETVALAPSASSTIAVHPSAICIKCNQLKEVKAFLPCDHMVCFQCIDIMKKTGDRLCGCGEKITGTKTIKNSVSSSHKIKLNKFLTCVRCKQHNSQHKLEPCEHYVCSKCAKFMKTSLHSEDRRCPVCREKITGTYSIKCVICCNSKEFVALNPCQHFMCTACERKTKNCPFCRQAIVSTTAINFFQ